MRYFAAFVALLFALVVWFDHEQRHKPTADDLYGCTPRMQAPSGECQ